MVFVKPDEKRILKESTTKRKLLIASVTKIQ